MATAKGLTIARYAESKIGCAYIWGGYGEKLCSPSFRKERASAYPSQKNNIYQYCQVLNGKAANCNGCKYQGKQAYDCAQLTKYACKAAGQALVSGANSQWNKTAWAKKGTIDTMPDVAGVILYYKSKSGEMSHTGVYVGGGYAVEARSAKYGVVKTAVKNRSWTHWAALPGVLSEEPDQTPAQTTQPTETAKEPQKTASGVITMQTIRYGSKGTQVKVLQWLLIDKGFNPGTADGIFGKNTQTSVRAFQKVAGLSVDGVVGKNTWSKLLA